MHGVFFLSCGYAKFERSQTVYGGLLEPYNPLLWSSYLKHGYCRYHSCGAYENLQYIGWTCEEVLEYLDVLPHIFVSFVNFTVSPRHFSIIDLIFCKPSQKRPFWEGVCFFKFFFN